MEHKKHCKAVTKLSTKKRWYSNLSKEKRDEMNKRRRELHIGKKMYEQNSSHQLEAHSLANKEGDSTSVFSSFEIGSTSSQSKNCDTQLKILNMDRLIKPINEIFPANKRWTAKVLVCEKSMPRISRYGSSRYQHLVLIDAQGTKVQATIFGNDIQLYENIFNLFQTYYISNAPVRTIIPMHRIVNNEYQWIINNSTVVEEVPLEDDADMPQNPPEFHFVPFNQLKTYTDSLAHVDVAALALDVQPIRYIQTSNGPTPIQEITLINQEKSPILLTLWDQFITNEVAIIASQIATIPVVVAMRLKVVSYNKLSLSTKSSSCIMINPDLPETHVLHHWRDENNAFLVETLAKKTYLFPSTSPMLTNESVTLISSVQSSSETKPNFWIKGKISLTDFNQKFWYMACEKCHKFTETEFDQLFNCSQCGKQNVKATPRCCVQIQLTDTSGELPATIFGENAEKFLGYSSKELMEHTQEDGLVDLEGFANTSNSKEYNMYIKTWKQERSGQTIVKYNVGRLFETLENK